MIGSLPCLEGFSSGCPVFFPPQTQHTKFQFDLEMRAKGLPALLLSVTLNKVDYDCDYMIVILILIMIMIIIIVIVSF